MSVRHVKRNYVKQKIREFLGIWDFFNKKIKKEPKGSIFLSSTKSGKFDTFNKVFLVKDEKYNNRQGYHHTCRH